MQVSSAGALLGQEASLGRGGCRQQGSRTPRGCVYIVATSHWLIILNFGWCDPAVRSYTWLHSRHVLADCSSFLETDTATCRDTLYQNGSLPASP
jgi:hypothetical protein